MDKQSTGKLGEALAAQYLMSNGYDIIERRYRSRHGEIDIIAKQSDVLCFVEVKTRSNASFGSPAEAVNHKKQRAATLAAQAYLQQLQTLPICRFDVIEVDAKTGEITHIENAFMAMEE